VFKGLNRAV